MASSGATPAAPSIALRPHAHERDAVTTSESVSFPELVWAHYLYQRALHDEGELHGPAEEEFRSQLGRFVAENGPIVNAYWCTGEASGVALTEKPGERVLGFLWRQRPNIRLHAATDWATRDAPEINHALHTCETLAIRVSEVLSCTSERIAMQWLLSIAGYLLSVVDDREKKTNRHELVKASNRARAELAQVEHYYDRAGEKTGRLVYFWGMLIGVVALAVLAVPGVLTYRLFGNYSADSARTFFICYAMGAVGAIVSVMMRMASKTGAGFVDYEVGRPSLRRIGSFRPIIGAVFGVVVYFALKSDLITLKTSSGQTDYFYATIAFIAGFSERRARILLGGAERMLGGGSGEDAPAEPQPTSRRKAHNGQTAGGPA